MILQAKVRIDYEAAREGSLVDPHSGSSSTRTRLTVPDQPSDRLLRTSQWRQMVFDFLPCPRATLSLLIRVMIGTESLSLSLSTLESGQILLLMIYCQFR